MSSLGTQVKLRNVLKQNFGLLLLVGLFLMTACSSPKVEKPAEATALSIEIDEDWLPAPEDLPSSAIGYEAFIEKEKMADLAIASQAIGESFFSRGDKVNGLKFYAQAGRALRYAVEQGTSAKVHPLDVTAIFYYEARALAQAGRLEDAGLALKDSLVHGFDNIEMLKTDPDLQSLRDSEDFDANLENWIGEAVAVKLRKKQPSFSIQFDTQDLDGNALKLEDYQGKIVVIDIWGMWCQPCVQEIPSFIALQEKYRDELQILGFNFERNGTVAQNLPRVKSFVAKAGINYPCIIGFDSIKRQIPNFGKYPTTVFIDRTGKVRLLAEGFHDPEYLDGIVKALVNEGSDQ